MLHEIRIINKMVLLLGLYTLQVHLVAQFLVLIFYFNVQEAYLIWEKLIPSTFLLSRYTAYV